MLPGLASFEHAGPTKTLGYVVDDLWEITEVGAFKM